MTDPNVVVERNLLKRGVRFDNYDQDHLIYCVSEYGFPKT